MPLAVAATAAAAQDIANTKYSVKPEAEGFATEGSPEARVFNAVPPGPGIPLAELKAAVPGEAGDVGFRQAMTAK